MIAVVAASGGVAEEALERLRLWSLARYLVPFVWADEGGICRRVENGTVQEHPLGAAVGEGAVPFSVGFALAGADGTIGAAQISHVLQVHDRLEDAVPGMVLPPPALVYMPVDDATRITPPAPGKLRKTLVVVPEDLHAPTGGNRLDPHDISDVAAHAAHSIACLAGLWVGVNDAPLLPGKDDGPDTQGAVTFVRCHSRLVDAGFLPDALAVKAFGARPAWPNPAIDRFTAEFADTTMTTVVSAYLAMYDEVLGLRKVERARPPREKRVPLIAALKAILRYFIDQLAARPWQWVDERLEQFWEEKIVAPVDRLGSASGTKVVHWRERPEEESSVGFMAERIPSRIGSANGPVKQAWRDLVALSCGLADGGELPIDVNLQGNEGKRLVELRPGLIAPDPRDVPPAGPPPRRPCDPADLAERAASASSGNMVADGDPDITEQLISWQLRRRASLVWGVGEKLAERLAEARRDAIPPTREDWELLERRMAESQDKAKRGARRRRRWLALRTVAAVGVTAALLIVDPGGPIRPLGLAATWALYVGAIVFSWRRARKRGERDEQHLLAEAAALADKSLVAAVRSGDVERLEARYAEYLDWAEIIGGLVHHPWVAGDTPYTHPEGLIRPPSNETLPAACRVGYAAFSDMELAVIAATGEGSVFTEGWLRRRCREVLDAGATSWRRLQQSSGTSDQLDPDPFGSEPGLREAVLGHVRSGTGRSLDEAGIADEFFGKVASEPAAKILARIADSREATDSPLPPAAEWAASPEGLDERARKVERSVVAITGTLGDERRVWRGSGVLVSTTGLVATCRHCVAGWQNFAVVGIDRKELQAELVLIAEDNDVALLRVTSDPSFASNAAALSENGELVRGTPIFTLGYPFFGPDTGGPSLAWGIVTAPRRIVRVEDGKNEVRVQTNYPAGGGASGSGVFDANGKVIGIHTSGASDRDAEGRTSHISFAAPAECVVRLIEKAEGGLTGAASSDLVLEAQHAGKTEPYAAFIASIASDAGGNIGDHGVLGTKARAVVDPWVSAAVKAVRSHRPGDPEVTLAAALGGEPLAIGDPVRLAAVRVDRTATFHVRLPTRRSGDRLPWFEPPADEPATDSRGLESDPSSDLAGAEGLPLDDLGDI